MRAAILAIYAHNPDLVSIRYHQIGLGSVAIVLWFLRSKTACAHAHECSRDHVHSHARAHAVNTPWQQENGAQLHLRSRGATDLLMRGVLEIKTSDRSRLHVV